CLIAGGGCEKSHSLCPPVYITGRWNSPLGERGVKVPVDCNLLLETTPDVIAAEPGVVPLYKLGPLKHTALI
ncbi:MAG: hypothetical protein OXC05_04400, partial [Halieaceae bacterium]|nr:hypothetical protein [Halieaceae bacterium]